MRIRQVGVVALPAVLLALLAATGSAQQPKHDPQQEVPILKQAEAFVAAFEKGDAKAIAGFWAVDGAYARVIAPVFFLLWIAVASRVISPCRVDGRGASSDSRASLSSSAFASRNCPSN